MSSTEQSVTGITRTAVFVTGIVQGVGFRPFIYRIARDAGLSGFVLNTSEGVEIEVEGPRERIDAFVKAVRRQAPPLSRITGLSTAAADPTGETGFSILPSSRMPGKHQIGRAHV